MKLSLYHLSCPLALALLVWSTTYDSAKFLVCSQEIAAANDGDELSSQLCPTIHVDLLRRQATEWRSLEPYTVEDGSKHTPYLQYDNVTGTATVIVGNGNETGGVYHPMDASGDPSVVHFITQIYVVNEETGDIVVSQTMDPTQPAPATFSFVVPEGVTLLTPYEFCNLHGLWRGPAVQINASTTTISSSTSGGECQVESPVPVAYDSYAADFVRRQQLPPFSNMEPYTEGDGTLHTPYITVHTTTTNKSATVIVGTDEKRHVMWVGGYGDSDEPHWITTIYVMDQNSDIITLEYLDPTYADHAEVTFVIPEHVTELTAYQWCNIHGLYVGPTVNATTGQVIEKEKDTASPQAGQGVSSGYCVKVMKNTFSEVALAVIGAVAMITVIVY